MVRINFQVAERLQGIADLPRKTASGVYATLVGTALSPLSLLNIVSSRKMKDVNLMTAREFLNGSTILTDIYVAVNAILKPGSFENCDVNGECNKGHETANKKLEDIAAKVAFNHGSNIKGRLRFLQFGLQTTGYQSAKFLLGSFLFLASIPCPASSKAYSKLSQRTVRYSSAGRLPGELHLAILGMIKPKAAAMVINPNLFNQHVNYTNFHQASFPNEMPFNFQSMPFPDEMLFHPNEMHFDPNS